MRYAEDHAVKTKEKVLRTAAAQLRKDGPNAVSVARVMSAAGLTHGGFYAHFNSKDDLIAGAIDSIFADASVKWTDFMKGREGTAALAAFIDRYVSSIHRDRPENGCAIPILASDLPRLKGKARTRYDAGVRGLLARIAMHLPDDRKQIAASIVAEMVGAVVLSRSVSDRAESDRFLTDARAALKARAGCEKGA